jgi:hypothetical protein
MEGEVRFLASAHGRGISFRDSGAGNVLVNKCKSDNGQVLFGIGLPQDLCPEEGSLGLLNDLLVNRLGRVVHDDGALLVVDLGVNPGVADEVDNPLLTLILAQTKTSGQIPERGY